MYLLEDFLLLDRGESLWEERDDVSFEYERSERSDLSERGDDERPLLLLLRGGLADPLCLRFLSTVGDKYLSDKKKIYIKQMFYAVNFNLLDKYCSRLGASRTCPF